MISPAAPLPRHGTCGWIPEFSNSTNRSHNSGETPASGCRNVRNRTASTARAAGSGNHGADPTARPTTRFAWCLARARASRVIPAIAPMPVVTP